MAEQERHDFVRSIRPSLLDLPRRIEASSTVKNNVVRLRQISRHLLRPGRVDYVYVNLLAFNFIVLFSSEILAYSCYQEIRSFELIDWKT